MVKHRKPPVRHQDSTHVQTLKQENAVLEQENRFLRNIYPPAFRKPLYQLHKQLDALQAAAEPGKAATTDGDGRGTTDPLSHDGVSTSQGRDTTAARRRVEYWYRRVAGMASDIENDLDPMKVKVPPRRCGSSGCRRRIGETATFCQHCGHQQASPHTPRSAKGKGKPV